MSSSREDSPDWLHSFQAPTHSPITFLDSDSSPNDSTSMVDATDVQHAKPDNPLTLDAKIDGIRPMKQKRKDNRDNRQVAEEVMSEEHTEPHAGNHSVWTLSSDSSSSPDNSPRRKTNNSRAKDSVEEEDAVLVSSSGGSPIKKASKEKSPNKRPKVKRPTLNKQKNTDDNTQRKGATGNHDHMAIAEGETFEHIAPQVSTSGLPLVLSENVRRSKALVECEGDSVDLSGDMGAVGRIMIPNTPSGNNEMYLDLKGTIYKTTIVPSRTFCVVSFGQSEAKIEAIMDDFIQLKPQSNVFEAETLVEGMLEGFSFDSEDEADKMVKANQTGQNEDVEDQTNGKAKGKAEKSTGVVRKKAKTAGGKQAAAKKGRKKTQVSKKAKSKK